MASKLLMPKLMVALFFHCLPQWVFFEGQKSSTSDLEEVDTLKKFKAKNPPRA
jgi:hypothetical protein